MITRSSARRDAHAHASTSSLSETESRLRWLKLIFLFGLGAILLRLAYWQIWMRDGLSAEAAAQYQQNVRLTPQRGTIRDNQGTILVGNEERYRLFAEPDNVKAAPAELADELTPILMSTIDKTPIQATDEAWLSQQKDSLHNKIKDSLSDTGKKWIGLASGLTRDDRQQVENLKQPGLGFDTEMVRSYPDASVSAQLLGFVGKTDAGQDQGYFGLEGYYDLELRGRNGVMRQQRSALGLPLLLGDHERLAEDQGTDLTLTVDASLQYQIEQKLKDGMEKYGAIAGEVIVLDPYTGAVKAMASFPNYDPTHFIDYPSQYYRNPVISDLYEPGSTLKVVTVAAGIDSGAITPDTECPRCSGPVQMSGFSIKTWDDTYIPNINMKDALAKSDNTAMVFIQQQIGQDKFLEALRKFGLDGKTGIDLQGEGQFPFRPDKDWREIDVATAAFGQGIAATSLQVARATAVIANGGKLMQPYIVQSVQSGDQVMQTQPKMIRQVISPETAKTVTDMMIYATENGEAKFSLPKGHVPIAGKTGTAQISENGKYIEDKTVASFVGFAPADHPQFIMLVKLRAPTSSQWGSETATPLWMSIMPLLLK